MRHDGRLSPCVLTVCQVDVCDVFSLSGLRKLPHTGPRLSQITMDLDNNGSATPAIPLGITPRARAGTQASNAKLLLPVGHEDLVLKRLPACLPLVISVTHEEHSVRQ